MKKNTAKRILIAVLLLVLLSLCACGKKSAAPAATAPTVPATEATTQPVEKESLPTAEESICGTWAVSAVNVQGVEFTAEQAIVMGAKGVDDTQIIVNADGTLYLISSGSVNTCKWHADADGIVFDAEMVTMDHDRIEIKSGDNSIYFAKISDDQTPPAAEAPTEPETTEPETTAPSGIRPEFKEAMDSYEAFYEEYFTFMEKFAKNPTDFSLLAKYTDMLSKAEEMDKKFKAWNDSDLSNEELKYYLDVTNRIQKRLLDLF